MHCRALTGGHGGKLLTTLLIVLVWPYYYFHFINSGIPPPVETNPYESIIYQVYLNFLHFETQKGRDFGILFGAVSNLSTDGTPQSNCSRNSTGGEKTLETLSRDRERQHKEGLCLSHGWCFLDELWAIPPHSESSL